MGKLVSRFIIVGMDCASCALSVESVFKNLKGVKNVNVNYASKKMRVEHDASLTVEEIVKLTKDFGYKAVLEEDSNQSLKEAGSLELFVGGMNSDHCVMVVTKAVKSLDGIKQIKASSQTLKASIEYDSNLVDKVKILKVIKDAGYDPKEINEKENVLDQRERLEKEELSKLKKRMILAIIFTAPLLYAVMGEFLGLPVPNIINPETNLVNFALFQILLSFPVMFAGQKFYTKGIPNLLRRRPNMDSLIGLGTLAAYSYSVFSMFKIIGGDLTYRNGLYFETAGMIISLILIGKYLEELTKGRTSQAIKKLLKLQAKNARVRRKGKELMIPVQQVLVGDIIIVKPGEKIPVDGLVVKGSSSVDESIITGESIPVEKTKESKVIGSSMNKNGLIEFKVTGVGKDTVLSQIIKMVEDAQSTKAPIQKLADEVSAIFVPIVILIALISGITWFTLGSLGVVTFEQNVLNFALTSMITVLVIACPCALGLATPTAVMVGTGKGAENGILIKSAQALEDFGKTKTIILDKTGTITKGKPEVTDIVNNKKFSELDVLYYSASVEKGSEHPLGEAIVNKANKDKIKFGKVSGFKAIPGQGLSAKVSNKKILLGNKTLMKKQKVNVETLLKDFNDLSSQGKTVMFLSINKKLAGLIAVRDEVKETSKEAIQILKELGLNVVMITGDNEDTAKAISEIVGIDKYLAEVLPGHKAREVKNLQSKGMKVSMVGDGINDAPALAQSDVGVAIGAGTDVAIESAKIVLVNSDLMDVVKAYKLSKGTMNNIKQNLFWAFAYNTAGIPLAAGIFYPFFGWTLSPMFAAGAMSFSSISVLLNSLRLKRIKL